MFGYSSFMEMDMDWTSIASMSYGHPCEYPWSYMVSTYGYQCRFFDLEGSRLTC